MDLTYYLKVDEPYHKELGDLLNILAQDQITEEVEREKEIAQERIEELVELSKGSG